MNNLPVLTVTRPADLPRWFMAAQPTAEEAAARFEKAFGRKPRKVVEMKNSSNHWFTVDLDEEGVSA